MRGFLTSECGRVRHSTGGTVLWAWRLLVICWWGLGILTFGGCAVVAEPDIPGFVTIYASDGSMDELNIDDDGVDMASSMNQEHPIFIVDAGQPVTDTSVTDSAADARLSDRDARPVADEICNGVDDDLDGEIDEWVTNACGVCGEVPLEVCDGQDNDCDGNTDENLTNACGRCGATPAEICDGADNDCDGRIDEGALNACGACGPLPLEVCDGLDNDCDGLTDPHCDCVHGSQRPCGLAEGLCEPGEQVCIAGLWSQCLGATEPNVERCNFQDDDCDGAIDEGNTCPCSVFSRGQRGYLICGAHAHQNSIDQPKSWMDARRQCRALGFEFAALESQGENAYIYRKLRDLGSEDSWLGLNDRQREDSFVWSNGEPVNYQNWDEDEPNDGGESGEDCGIMLMSEGRESFWDDRDCRDLYGYVCEITF